jgi:hypothetical protein
MLIKIGEKERILPADCHSGLSGIYKRTTGGKLKIFFTYFLLDKKVTKNQDCK